MTLISALGRLRTLPTACLIINLPGGSVTQNWFFKPVTWNYTRVKKFPDDAFQDILLRQIHKFMAATATKNKCKYDEFLSKIVNFLEKISIFSDKCW